MAPSDIQYLQQTFEFRMFWLASLYYMPADHSKWLSNIPKGNKDSTAFR